ncbi:MAG: Alkyl hydroperoxide reductase subunit C [Opitutia bacterium UBA7350]|nr:MAG: Alkyl hydroperoxide reductase subunit C [Opitutae bacterium UBA7350]
MLSVGEIFPKFQVQACTGLNKSDLQTLSNEDFEGQWQVYFFYPKDFTVICPTEIAGFNAQLEKFHDRDTSVIGGSTDNEYCHLVWRQTHEDLRTLGFPLIAAGHLAHLLGILDTSKNACLRATFIVDPDGVIQYANCHSESVGRSVKEILRVLDALQSNELCACNWKKGDAALTA